ncbi:MAG: DNA translocase FtsK [Treponema sp.]|jgi:S-DNA-T family DNA segregation ATPase FtsK/SpoIIIE|nr:DNA translocase FtsK [Treponema sp.]
MNTQHVTDAAPPSGSSGPVEYTAEPQNGLLMEPVAAFLNRPDFRVRLLSLMAAFTLAFAALLMTLSTVAYLLNLKFINTSPGEFFVSAYGILALMIPAYLFWAAWILGDKAFKPGRIFVLSAVLVPFLTIASGFSLVRDFGQRREQFALLRNVSFSVFGFAVITLTVLECFAILVLHALLFREKSLRKPEPSPGPFAAPGHAASVAYAESSRHAVSVAYAESAVPELSGEEGDRVPLSERIQFPELKPLAASLALQDLDQFGFFNTEEYPETPAAAGIDSPPANSESPGLSLRAGTNSAPPRESEEAEIPEAESEEVETGEMEIPEIAEEDYSEPEVLDEQDEIVSIPLSLFSPYAQTAEDEMTGPEAEREQAAGPEAVKNTEMEYVEISGEPVVEAVPEHAKAPRPAVSEPAKKNRSFGNRRGTYLVPVEGILNQYPDGQYWIVDETTQKAARILQETLKEFSIEAEVTGIRKGPVITMFEILPAPGVKLSKIVNLQDNIALRLAASSVRIVAPIPGKHAVGIEVPNKKRNIVSFREIIEGELRREGKRLEIPVVLGKDITGEAVTVDLAQMPHLLIAGSTGSGKSVCVNSMILSILYQRSPAECRLMLIDPKIVELKLYNDIPHLLVPVITEPKKAFQALQYCIFEMERRYACLDSMGVRDIKSYNRRIRERGIAAENMPYIIVVIDEFADLMATTGKELESTVARLAAMSRAVGIHLVLATQRPSIDVITGLIKANIPSRIAFMVASKMDSRIIIDMVGAEKLLGKGDMLYAGAIDPFPIRMQGAFISEEEVERVVEHVKSLGEPEYIEDEIFYEDDEEDSGPSLFSDGDDPLYDKALEIVYQQGRASASYIQRRLKIGYNRAARIVEEMEHRGVVGPAQGSRPRELLHIA